MEAILYFAVRSFLGIWAAFWVIRLAVRFGMNDALRMSRDWLAAALEQERLQPTLLRVGVHASVRDALVT